MNILSIKFKSEIPQETQDGFSEPVMNLLQKTYGKTIHTWAIDVHPDLPIGPPHLMMSWTGEGQGDLKLVEKRDKEGGVDTERVRKLRAEELDETYVKAKGVDDWEVSGKGIIFEPKEVKAKLFHA